MATGPTNPGELYFTMGGNTMQNVTFTNNVVVGRYYGHTTSVWFQGAQFAGNFINNDDALAFYGGFSGGCFWSCNDADGANPHFVAPKGSAPSFNGDLFECAHASNDGAGDCIFPDTGQTSLSVTNCIVLPSSNGKTAGKLISNLQASTTAITANHNTYCATNGEGGLAHLDETASSYSGELASVRSNLIWASSADTHCLAIYDGGVGTPAVDAVTVARYNGFWNPASGTCYYNSSTSQGSVVGYSGIKISPNTTYPNATVGNNDVTITSDPFVDKTRNLAKWGQVIRGTDGSYSAAIAQLAANPTLLQGTTGLFAWVRAGWDVTGSAGLTLKDAGHDSVTIGAGSYVASGAAGTHPRLVDSNLIAGALAG